MTLNEYKWISPRATEWFTVELLNGNRTTFFDSWFNAKFMYGYLKDNVPMLKFEEPSPIYKNLIFEYNVKLSDVSKMTREYIERDFQYNNRTDVIDEGFCSSNEIE